MLILFLQNVEKVHHMEEGSHHELVLVLQVITKGVGHPQKLMMREKQEAEGAPGQDLLRISFALVTERMGHLSIEREGSLWKGSPVEGASHPQEEWMKVDPSTEGVRGRNLLTVSTILQRSWMRTEIESQGIVRKGTPDPDLLKIRVKLMKEMVKTETKNQNIVILRGLGQNLLKENTVIKIN